MKMSISACLSLCMYVCVHICLFKCVSARSTAHSLSLFVSQYFSLSVFIFIRLSNYQYMNLLYMCICNLLIESVLYWRTVRVFHFHYPFPWISISILFNSIFVFSSLPLLPVVLPPLPHPRPPSLRLPFFSPSLFIPSTLPQCLSPRDFCHTSRPPKGAVPAKRRPARCTWRSNVSEELSALQPQHPSSASRRRSRLRPFSFGGKISSTCFSPGMILLDFFFFMEVVS